MEEGEIEVDSITPIGLPDITPMLARESGFLGVVDLLKVAKHGKGQNIYLVRFHYEAPGTAENGCDTSDACQLADTRRIDVSGSASESDVDSARKPAGPARRPRGRRQLDV